MSFRSTPPECAVCGEPHTTCTPSSASARAGIAVSQLPGRDGTGREPMIRDRVPSGDEAAILDRLDDDAAPLDAPTSFSTAEYRRELHNPRRRPRG